MPFPQFAPSRHILLLFASLAFSLPALSAQATDTLMPARLDSLILRSRAETKARNYSAAFATNAKAFALAEACCGPESAAYAAACFNEGRIHHIMGDYEQAVEWYVPSMRIRKQTLGPLHEEYGKSLNNLAVAYKRLARFESAEPLYRGALRVRKELFGEESAPYASTLGNLAALYRSLGDLENAENLNLKAKAIREKVLGKDHPHYAISLLNLAVLYYETSQLNKAEAYYLRVKEFYERNGRNEEIEYLYCLDNLGALFMKKADYATAEKYYLKALDWARERLPPRDPQYTLIHNHLGLLYTRTHAFERAENYFVQAMQTLEEGGHENHPDYGFYQQNLALLYFKRGDYTAAKREQLASLTRISTALGKNHVRYRAGLREIATTDLMLGNLEEADGRLRELAETSRAPLNSAVRHLSEKELADYTLSFAENLNYYFTLAEQRPEIADLCFDEVLLHRGFLLNTALRINQFSPTDSLAGEQLKNLRGLHRRIAALYTSPPSGREELLYLEEEANVLEKALTRHFAKWTETEPDTDWRAVRAALGDNEAVVEFVNYYDRIRGDVGKYGALIIAGPSAKPIFVPLCVEAELNRLVEEQAGNQRQSVNSTYAASGKGRKLYQLIWSPIMARLSELPQNARLHIVKAGSLHRLNLGALPTPDGDVLANRYRVGLLTSSRDLLRRPSPPPVAESRAVLFGGVDYDETPAVATASAPPHRARGTQSIIDSTGIAYAWPPLPWTEVEVYSIEEIVKNAGFEVETRTLASASEKAFKKVGNPGDAEGAPRLLHLATHGYFFPDPQSTSDRSVNVMARAGHPLIRSGLILAGANPAWTGRAAVSGSEDGILTALEVSHLDLTDTELVVLSACETGLGDVRNFEGVYGLQRAFRIAGSQYLLMTLWQIPDYETQVFMDYFYRSWLEENKDISAAFHSAQRAMRMAHPETYLWAGFVLLE